MTISYLILKISTTISPNPHQQFINWFLFQRKQNNQKRIFSLQPICVYLYPIFSPVATVKLSTLLLKATLLAHWSHLHLPTQRYCYSRYFPLLPHQFPLCGSFLSTYKHVVIYLVSKTKHFSRLYILLHLLSHFSAPL